MPRARQVYHFTVRPSPETYPEYEVEAIGTFAAAVPADRTLGEFLDDLSGEFSFETPDTAVNAIPARNLDKDTPLGKVGLAVGDDLFLAGFTDFVLRLDSISPAGGPAGSPSEFNLTGFDVERMQEAAEDAYADPDADVTDEPVYRVQFQIVLENATHGNRILSTRDMRWRGRLSLGLLATAAVDEADALLNLSEYVLSVCPTPSPEDWLTYASGDYDSWEATSIDELGVEPTPAPVVGPDSAARGGKVRGWTVIVRPPEGGEVTGVVRMVVMSNGDYWKLRSLSPR